MKKQERKCACGALLAPRKKRCDPCAKLKKRESDRRTKAITLAPDAISCPVCLGKFNVLTAAHYRTHGFKTAKEFKQKFGLAFLKAPSLRLRHSALMKRKNPMQGRSRTPEEIRKMSAARKGKGLGVAGKYERTPEIREKISKGVTAYMLDKPDGYQHRFAKSEWVWCKKAGKEVWVRSSWEKRVLWVLDQYPDVETVEVEPFSIPYLFEGAWLRYVPDFLVTFQGNIRELWEIKPQYRLKDPKVQAKKKALQEFADENDMHARVVTEHNLEKMEHLTRWDLKHGLL